VYSTHSIMTLASINSSSQMFLITGSVSRTLIITFILNVEIIVIQIKVQFSGLFVFQLGSNSRQKFRVTESCSPYYQPHSLDQVAIPLTYHGLYKGLLCL